MKRTLTPLVVCAALILGTAGCNQSTPPPTASQTPAPASKPDGNREAAAAAAPSAASGQAVELKVKWPVGSKLTYRMEFEQESETPAMPPQFRKQETSFAQVYTLDVTKERPNGGRELEIEFNALEMDVKLGGQTISFDSKGDADSDHVLMKSFRKMIGTRIKMLLDGSGNVEKVENLDAWYSQLTEGVPQQAQGMVRGIYTENYFKQIVEFGRDFPNKAVKMGDSWPYQTELPGGQMGKITMEYNNTVKGFEEREKYPCVVLDFSGTLKSGADGAQGPMGKVTLEKGVVSGTTWFDHGQGILVETTNEQNMGMRIEMPAKAPPLAGGKLQSFIKQKVSIKLVAAGKITG